MLAVSVLQSLPQTGAAWVGHLEPWLPWIVGLWAAGVAFFSLRLLAGWQTIRGLCGAAGCGTDAKWIERFSRLQARVGVSYPVRLVFSTSAKVPMVIGWLKPVVLVPAGLVAGLSISQLEAILAHELIHIRRHDYLVNLLQNVVETLFFYHPAVAWVSARIRVEREHCCDDVASLACGGTLDYARALAALAESRRAPALGVAATGGSLVERIRRLAGIQETRGRHGFSSAAGTVLPLAVAVVVLAVLCTAVAQQRMPAPNGAAASAAQAPATGKAPAPNAKPADVMTVRGQVLRPDGRPAAGATVFSLRNYWTASVKWKVLGRSTADAQGKFEIRIAKNVTPDGLGSTGLEWIAAQAPGFGLDWTAIDGDEFDPSKPVVLTLARDLPIRGRVVDLEERPVEGVRVGLISLRGSATSGDLGPWLAAAKTGQSRSAVGWGLGKFLPGFEDDSRPPIKTDRDGRFTLSGIGAERVARLELRGETIAYRQIDVATRAMNAFTHAAEVSFGRQSAAREQVFGAEFTFQAAPTKVLLGTVRDAATGRPLSGVTVESIRMGGTIVNPFNVLRTKTDAQGHYRLVGLPKSPGDRSEITILPADDQPYFFDRLRVPDSPGLDPVTLDIGLHRGMWVTGRVTDKATGKPVSACVVYFPFRSNKLAAGLHEFTRDNYSVFDGERYSTRPDGTYRLAALPGRGIVGVDAPRGPYRKGIGASKIEGMTKDGHFPTFLRLADSSWENSLKEINPAPGTESVSCDFVLDPGGSIHVTVVDRSGKPVSGCATTVRSAGNILQGVVNGSTFDVEGLGPNETRDLLVYEHRRQIGKALKLTYSASSPHAVTVILDPCATIAGRLLDGDGAPLAGVEVGASPAPAPDMVSFPIGEMTDADGRFQCAGCVPGSDYKIVVHGNEIGFRLLLNKIAIEPGKKVLVGDFQVKRESD